MLQVATIVVNYRSAGLVKDLLASIHGGPPGWFNQVVVVDNASPDDSVVQLHAAVRTLGMTGHVRVVPSPRNGGFGAGNNLGAREALRDLPRPDVLWFLNPDTLVGGTNLEPALAHFRRDPRVGIVGTGLDNGQGSRELGAHRDLTPVTEFIRNAGALKVLGRFAASSSELERPGPVDWVSGASLLMRTDAFESLGGFDEGFFLYFEEVDLCRRARAAGWGVCYEPSSRVVHLEGQTTGVTHQRARPGYWYESRRRYYIKHAGVGGLLAADAAWALGRAVGRLRGRPSDGCRWRDLWRYDGGVIMGFDDAARTGARRGTDGRGTT